jgi:hypothetical protein
MLGRLWKLLSLAADSPARVAGEEAGDDEATHKDANSLSLNAQRKVRSEAPDGTRGKGKPRRSNAPPRCY